MRVDKIDLDKFMLFTFPFLFGGTFIEGLMLGDGAAERGYFPSFSEGLSLRVSAKNEGERYGKISLPFRRDFH